MEMDALECKRILDAAAKWDRLTIGVPYDSDLTPSGRIKWLIKNIFKPKG